MKLLTEQLTDVISKESAKPFTDQQLKAFDKLLTDMKKSGILKKPTYNLPLADTIGKNWYTSINKQKQPLIQL